MRRSDTSRAWAFSAAVTVRRPAPRGRFRVSGSKWVPLVSVWAGLGPSHIAEVTST
jgi:hypothetical protein